MYKHNQSHFGFLELIKIIIHYKYIIININEKSLVNSNLKFIFEFWEYSNGTNRLGKENKSWPTKYWYDLVRTA
jgi:hypothetical protein